MLDRHGDGHRVAHRLHAVGHELRLGHQAGPEGAALHALARAAAVEVDLVVARRLAEPRDRLLGEIEIAWRELPQPLAVRRLVCFSQAVYAGECSVEGVTARRSRCSRHAARPRATGPDTSSDS